MRMNTPNRDDEINEGMEELGIESDEELEELEEVTEEQLMQMAQDYDQIADEEDEVEDIVDMANLVFHGHESSVFACDLCSTKDYAASGGEDDKAYVWGTATGQVLFECGNHKDSVTCVKFSADGNLLATGDMSGFIQVWKINTKAMIWSFEVSDLSWLMWHHKVNVLFAGTAEGDIWMWLVRSGVTKTFPSFGSPCTTAQLNHDGTKIAAGYQNGEVRTFDCKTNKLIQCYSGYGMHEDSVTKISWHRDRPLIISSSVTGKTKIYNTVSGDSVATYDCDSVAPHPDMDSEMECSSVETASFCPTLAQFSVTGNLRGVITIWDIVSHSSRHHIIQGTGTSKIIWHPVDPIFFAACLDGVVRVYDVRTGQLKTKYTGHSDNLLDIALSKDGKMLLTSSDDKTVRIFELPASHL